MVWFKKTLFLLVWELDKRKQKRIWAQEENKWGFLSYFSRGNVYELPFFVFLFFFSRLSMSPVQVQDHRVTFYTLTISSTFRILTDLDLKGKGWKSSCLWHRECKTCTWNKEELCIYLFKAQSWLSLFPPKSIPTFWNHAAKTLFPYIASTFRDESLKYASYEYAWKREIITQSRCPGTGSDISECLTEVLQIRVVSFVWPLCVSIK